MTTYSLTVPNKNGAYDGDMVVKQYDTLTISAGNTLTTDQPCRGLIIYVKGDCTINGTLTMTARGAKADPTVAGASDAQIVSSSGLRFPFKYSGGTASLVPDGTLLNGCGTGAKALIANHRTLSSNGIIATIAQIGAAGGGDTGCATGYAVNHGSSGSTGQSGGGGSGGRATGGMYASSSHGGTGSCFAGGAGGGGAAHAGSSACASPSGAGGNYGGAGGYATAYTGSGNGNGHTAGGGAGNPGGPPSGRTDINANAIGNATPATGYGYADFGGDGCGGLLVLIVGGNLTVNSGGAITSAGSNGGNKNTAIDGAGGGASGGGNIILAYRGNFTNNGTIHANGGTGGQILASTGQPGGNGGNGTVQTFKIK